jgi:hypothetical protein
METIIPPLSSNLFQPKKLYPQLNLLKQKILFVMMELLQSY